MRVLTDHQPLTDMAMQPGHPPRRLRWLEQLQAFDLNIVYVPGWDNVVADALSRPPIDATELHSIEAEPVSK